ncbi:MAG: type III-A CRISPR-associated RAMP protein Csm5 [Pseudomonadota bacterium]|nr:type III-A CRISPR-associated RAMP protein Csm5 [Pseudomonadota bacterium]
MYQPIKSISIAGTFLSPVHIGTGQEIDPFSSFIKQDRLYYFELSSVLARLPDAERAAFMKLLGEGSLVEVRKFLAARVDQRQDAIGSIAVAPDIAAEYAGKIGDQHNQLIFQPFFRNGHNFKPLLPGSSLKGAIRTAVIDALIRERNINLSDRAKRDPRYMEREVLGHQDIDQDPFKALKCADIPLPEDGTIIQRVYNYSERREKLTDLGLRIEMTKSLLDGAALHFEGLLDFFEGYRGRTIPNRDKKAISLYLTPAELLSACRYFYANNLREEHERFYRDSPYEATSARLLQIGDELGSDECLLRLGRFTQAESKSINKYRTVKVRGEGGTRDMLHGTTRNLAAGRYPMGWIKLKFSGVDATVRPGTDDNHPSVTRQTPPTGRRVIITDTGKKNAPVDLSRLKDRFPSRGRR